ncbi:MAG: PilZ domain-containing protein [Deltaproteobacteria bacterium]|nr:PilZ domain-containing protein [Deltaproteobacteria bacterium]
MNQPSILVLDDGELGHVHRVLWELGMDAVRVQGDQIGRSVPAPRDLLISAGRRTLGAMPDLYVPEGAVHPPQWICVHNQDYLPMRQRLRDMGVHYLVQSGVDEESLRRFLIQLLRSGADQRGELRLPLGGEIRYRTEGSMGLGGLVEFSADGCRIHTREAFEPNARIVVVLPPSLGGGNELELPGIAVREVERARDGGEDLYETAIQFEALDEATLERVRSIYRGERIGSRITPLAGPPEEVDAGSPEEADREEELEEASGDRRVEARHAYDRPVQLLGCGPVGGDPVLGCDLSLSGVRLTGCPDLEVGTQVTVALYGAAREEPVVLDATVSRSIGDGEVGLAFALLPADRRQSIEKLLRAQPLVDELQQPSPEAGRTIVAELFPA